MEKHTMDLSMTTENTWAMALDIKVTINAHSGAAPHFNAMNAMGTEAMPINPFVN